MRNPSTWLALPGPPRVITEIRSNARSASSTESIVTTMKIGRSIGKRDVAQRLPAVRAVEAHGLVELRGYLPHRRVEEDDRDADVRPAEDRDQGVERRSSGRRADRGSDRRIRATLKSSLKTPKAGLTMNENISPTATSDIVTGMKKIIRKTPGR